MTLWRALCSGLRLTGRTPLVHGTAIAAGAIAIHTMAAQSTFHISHADATPSPAASPATPPAAAAAAASADPTEDRIRRKLVEARAVMLFKQIRCLECANQSIEEAYSDQAVATKHIIRKRLQEGADEKLIKEELVQKFGPRVLYDTPINMHTLALWAVPLVFVPVALALVFRRQRRTAAAQSSAAAAAAAAGTNARAARHGHADRRA